MSIAPLLCLAPEVRVLPSGLSRDGQRVGLSDSMLLAALSSGLPPAAVAALLAGPQGGTLLAAHRAGMLLWRLGDVARAEVLTRGVELDVPQPLPGSVALSRFALVHKQGPDWVVESGLSMVRVTLSNAGLCLLTGDDPDGWLSGLLAIAGLLDTDDDSAEDWSVHDLLFQSRTRDHMAFVGKPARERGIPGEPALRPPEPVTIALARADGPQEHEPSLWEATQARRTVRDFTDRQVRLVDLGRLLWRTLRVCQASPADPEMPSAYETLRRPVPSGGAMHASDLWLVCRAVEGVPPGVYRYDPLAHGLVDIGKELPERGPNAPVTGLITTRHKRTAWKYEPFALALELKDLGVQFMALQITAPVLGLSIVPIGTGSTKEVAAQLGIDPLVDAPIGEFLLGPIVPGT